MRRRAYILAAALWLGVAALAAPSLAQGATDARTARIDAALAGLADAEGPGVVVGVWSRGQVVYRGARGMADLEQRTPLTAASVFHLASVSKQFTGLAVLKLAAAGKVDLDADVHRYLPELPDYGATIRVRDLLAMTSGLKDQWTLVRLSGRDWQDVMSMEMLDDVIVRNTQLDFVPGTDFSYSNSNYTLLAQIVARVTGRSFAHAMRELVFAPHGLVATFVYDDQHRLVPGRANSYWRLSPKGAWHRQLLAYQAWGATSVHSTIDDMLRWGVVVSRERLGGRPLHLALGTGARLADGRPNGYGAGLYRASSLGRDTYEHGGADASFRTMFRYFPEEDLGVVVLGNGQENAGRAADAVARAWLGEAAAAAPPAAPPPAGLTGLWAGGRTDGAIRIVQRAGGLVAEAADGVEIALHVTGRDQLTSRDGTYSLRPVRSPGGDVTALAAVDSRDHGTRSEYRLRRLSPPARIDAAGYVGEYRNAALDVTYRVRRGPAGLVLVPVLSALSFDLEPTDPDRFEAWDYAYRTVRFERRGGAVAALVVSGHRAADIRFDRVPSGQTVTSR